MPAQLKIDYVEFPSSDAAASQRFFGAAFGWRFVSYGPTYNAIEGAGLDSGIDADPDSAPKAPLVIVKTDDLAATVSAVVAAGGIITRPPFDFPGGRRFHFREPGGNELAVWTVREA